MTEFVALLILTNTVLTAAGPVLQVTTNRLPVVRVAAAQPDPSTPKSLTDTIPDAIWDRAVKTKNKIASIRYASGRTEHLVCFDAFVDEPFFGSPSMLKVMMPGLLTPDVERTLATIEEWAVTDPRKRRRER